MRRLQIFSPLPLVAWASLAATACGQHVLLGEIRSGIGDGGPTADHAPVADAAEVGDAAATRDAAETGDGREAGDANPSLLWSATFEAGDLSEWLEDGAGGTTFENIQVAPTVTTSLAHAGRFAGKTTTMPTLGMLSSNYLYREMPSPAEGYYGAWFYIPSGLTVTGGPGKAFLSIIHFNASRTSDGRNLSATWDVNLYPTTGGALAAQLYDYVNQINRQQAPPIPVPRDTWVHFEVLLVKASTPTGRIAVWQDDVLIFDAPNVVTTPNDWVQWNIGAATGTIDPSPSSLYVDDATISTSRWGDVSLSGP